MTQNINLYDPSLRAKQDWLTTGNAISAIGVCLLVVALATAWGQHDLSTIRQPAAETHTALEAAQKELTELTQRVATLKPDARLQSDLRYAQASLVQRQSALELLRAGGLGNDVGHAGAMGAFARQSLSGLWLTGLVLDHQQVALRGRAMTPDLIPAYVSRLNKEAALQGRSFRALSIERPLQAAESASAPARTAPFVEFSLRSSQGAEVPAPAVTTEAKP